MYVPAAKLCTKVLEEIHDVSMAEHQGEKTTHTELGKSFYWPNMKKDKEHYVRTCVKFQGTKSVHKKKYELHKPLPIPDGPFESNSMEFMMCLPLWEKKDVILVVVDRFSKLVKFGPTKMIATTTKTTTLFFNMSVRHHGMPEIIVNDQNAKFTLEFWTFLMKKAETKLQFSTTFHPQTNGQAERVNRILNQYL
jgi:hypothetical protein